MPARTRSVALVVRDDALRLTLERALRQVPRMTVADSRREDAAELECRPAPIDLVVLDRAALGALRDRSGVPQVGLPLSGQEREVLVRLALGMRTSEIAAALRRSPKTVEKHRGRLLEKLKLRGVAQLTAFAIHAGLITAERILREPAANRAD